MDPGTLTVGLDVSDDYTHAAVMGVGTEVLAEDRVRTRSPQMEKWLRALPASLVVLETGTHSRWIAQLAERCGHEVLVANPRELRMIYAGTNKTDRLDAIKLARVGRFDRTLLAPVQLRKPDEHADLAVIMARDAMVRARAEFIGMVRGMVKAAGARVANCSSEAFTAEANEALPAELRAALAPVQEQIDSLSEHIREYDKTLEHMALTKYPEIELLRQISGVGVLTALAFRLTLGDASRFRRSRDVGCYVGLRPKRDQSGKYDPQLGITKAGNPFLRRTLVNATHYILGPHGPDTDLRRWGLKLADRNIKGAKKRAVAAVARKLAVLMHRLWVSGEVYEPLRNSRRRERQAA
jgi:transposase